MSRPTYPQTPERRRVQQEALLQMRATRRSIDPALLQRMRDMILKGDPPSLVPAGAPPGAGEPVDKTRTLTVLKEFLILNRDNKKLCGEIRTMLTDKT